MADGLAGVLGRQQRLVVAVAGRLAGGHPGRGLGPGNEQVAKLGGAVRGEVEAREVEAVLGRGRDPGLLRAPERHRPGAPELVLGGLAPEDEATGAEPEPGAGDAGGLEQTATGDLGCQLTVADTRESGSASASMRCESTAVSSVESS